jgi:CheY-like chemotaxis protein
MSRDDGGILVVDDVPENVHLLEAVLVPRGYDVVLIARAEAELLDHLAGYDEDDAKRTGLERDLRQQTVD